MGVCVCVGVGGCYLALCVEDFWHTLCVVVLTQPGWFLDNGLPQNLNFVKLQGDNDKYINRNK